MEMLNNHIIYAVDGFHVFAWELISLLVAVVILPWDYNHASTLAEEIVIL